MRVSSSLRSSMAHLYDSASYRASSCLMARLPQKGSCWEMPITLADWGSLLKTSGSRASMFCNLNMNIGSSRAPACLTLLANICQRAWDDLSSGLLVGNRKISRIGITHEKAAAFLRALSNGWRRRSCGGVLEALVLASINKIYSGCLPLIAYGVDDATTLPRGARHQAASYKGATGVDLVTSADRGTAPLGR